MHKDAKFSSQLKPVSKIWTEIIFNNFKFFLEIRLQIHTIAT